MSDIRIVPVERLETTFAPRDWPFALERRDEIIHHFAGVQPAKPVLFNGSASGRSSSDDAGYVAAFLEFLWRQGRS
jgi:hypothetical protein